MSRYGPAGVQSRTVSTRRLRPESIVQCLSHVHAHPKCMSTHTSLTPTPCPCQHVECVSPHVPNTCPCNMSNTYSHTCLLHVCADTSSAFVRAAHIRAACLSQTSCRMVYWHVYASLPQRHATCLLHVYPSLPQRHATCQHRGPLWPHAHRRSSPRWSWPIFRSRVTFQRLNGSS